MSALAVKPVHVLQLNVARSNARMHTLLTHEHYDNIDIFILQDIWWGRIGSEKSDAVGDLDIYGTISNPCFEVFLPSRNQSKKGPSVAIFMRKGLRYLFGNVSNHIPFTLDSFAVDFLIYGSHLTIANIYLHGPNKRNTLSLLLDHPIDPHTPVLYVGDFNLHHEMWALDNGVTPSQTGDAADLAYWIIENDMLVINRPNLATRHGHANQSDSCIDLTIANNIINEQSLVSDWDADFTHSLGSDHAAITYTYNAPTDEPYVPPDNVYRYSIDTEHRDLWETAFKSAIQAAPPPSTYQTRNDCELGARALLEAMSQATSKSMKRVKVNRKGKRAPWWTADCSQIVDILSNDPFANREAEVRRLRSAIRSARRSHAQRVCDEVCGSELFRLQAWGSGNRAQRIPPLKLGNQLVSDPNEQAEALRGAFFPNAPPDVAVHDPLNMPKHDTRSHHPITEHEITKALESSSNKSAPGAFGSNYRVLKWVFHSNAEYLVNLYNGCLDLGSTPNVYVTP